MGLFLLVANLFMSIPDKVECFLDGEGDAVGDSLRD